MARKQILLHNIRVDRNCQPTWVTQNAIPEEQDLILLGGAITGLNNYILVLMEASTAFGMLKFAQNSFLELSNHQNLSQTSRNKRLNEPQ